MGQIEVNTLSGVECLHGLVKRRQFVILGNILRVLVVVVRSAEGNVFLVSVF